MKTLKQLAAQHLAHDLALAAAVAVAVSVALALYNAITVL